MKARQLFKSLAQGLTGRDDVMGFVRTRKLALRQQLYRTPISVNEFRSALSRLGVAKGRVIWLQSSWNEFYNLALKPREVVEILLEEIGTTGTLVMPAFPLHPDPTQILMIDRVPSSTGLLTEVFRRWPGVKRSIHLANSVCALGPEAEYLISDHHKTPLSCGPLTPYCRLADTDARLVCLGVGPFVHNLTPLHAVECLLHEELPYFRMILSDTMRYRWQRSNGETGEHEFYVRNATIDPRPFGRNYSPDTYVDFKVSNMTAFSIDARVAISRAVDLARQGITIYTTPKPRRALFAPDTK